MSNLTRFKLSFYGHHDRYDYTYDMLGRLTAAGFSRQRRRSEGMAEEGVKMKKRWLSATDRADSHRLRHFMPLTPLQLATPHCGMR